MKQRSPRTHRLAALSSLVVALGIVPVATGAAPAHASAVGGNISRAEIIDRANDWLRRAPAYSQTTYIWDAGQTFKYRTDCQGFVDMAWHLDGNPNTYEIPGSGLVDPVGIGDLQSGDELVDNQDGHAVLFDQWQPDHVHFTYFTFGGGASGTQPPSHPTGATSDAILAGWPTSHYQGYRYRHIGDPEPGPGKYQVRTFENAPGFNSPGGKQTGTLNQGQNYVYCKTWAADYPPGNPPEHNHYWLRTDLDHGNPWANQWVPAYYLANQGNDQALDINGAVIPDC